MPTLKPKEVAPVAGVATTEVPAPVQRESIDISDFSDEETVDLIEGRPVFTDLSIVETYLGNRNPDGQEYEGIFQRTDGKFFQYIWEVDNNDNYAFVNPPALIEVFATQKMVTVYE